MRIHQLTQAVLFMAALIVVLWFFRRWKTSPGDREEPRRDVVVGAFSTTQWLNDTTMVELVSYLCGEGIAATYERHTGPEGVFNYLIKAPESQAARAKELLNRKLAERETGESHPDSP